MTFDTAQIKDYRNFPYPQTLNFLTEDQEVLTQLQNTAYWTTYFDSRLYSYNNKVLDRNIALDSLIRMEYFNEYENNSQP
ncbi:MAG: hypothetical protein H7Y31_08250 [Chitinophagaceae bacterium]|nr:hypothetical protein [Chitinophagaceae bacterium]